MWYFYDFTCLWLHRIFLETGLLWPTEQNYKTKFFVKQSGFHDHSNKGLLSTHLPGLSVHHRLTTFFYSFFSFILRRYYVFLSGSWIYSELVFQLWLMINYSGVCWLCSCCRTYQSLRPVPCFTSYKAGKPSQAGEPAWVSASIINTYTFPAISFIIFMIYSL